MSGNYNRKKIALAGALMFMVTSVSAQTVKGVVTDNTGEPIIGASVMEVGVAGNGGVTDIDGNFTVNLKGKSKKLKISYIGMKAKEVSVAGKESIDVKLEDDNTTLNDVVVIGYGTMKKKDLTGSVSSVSAKDIANVPVSSAAQAIQGKMAGVSVMQTEGSPDADVKIRVRGGGSLSQDNSPLYIVDGFPVNSISDIAPSDIETIDVLKDASSTAIYGARGANGVIIVTTKSGKEGKVQVNFGASVGVRKVIKEVAVLNPYEYAKYQYELGETSAYGSYDDLDIWKSVKGNDYQDELFGRTGLQQIYNVGISGGSKDTKFNVSYARTNDKSIMMGSDYSKDNINAKLNSKLNNWFTLDFNARLSYQKVNGLGSGADTNESNAANSIVARTVIFRPIDPITAGIEDDDDSSSSYEASPYERMLDTYKQQRTFRQNYNLGLNWKPWKHVTFRSEFGYGWTFAKTEQAWGTKASRNSKFGYAGMPQTEIDRKDNKNWRNANTFTYDNKGIFFKKDKVNFLLGQEWSSSQDETYTSTTVAFPTSFGLKEALANQNSGTALANSNNIARKDNMFSFFGRLNYTINEKYLFTATLRADASSKFAKGNRWGYFPSAAFAWRMSDEKFMKDTQDWLSNLKLRLSYGTAGNNRISSGLIDPTYALGTATDKTPFFGGLSSTILDMSKLYNPDLKWETTITRDFGIDYGFFNGKINGTIDLYWNTTKDLLMQVPITSVSGYNYQYQNFGQTSNKGFEFAVNYNAIEKKNFTLTVNANISYNRNHIDKLNTTSEYQNYKWAGSTFNDGENFKVVEGGRLGEIYGYKYNGFYTAYDETTNPNGELIWNGKQWALRDGIKDNSYKTIGGKLIPGAIKLETDEDGNAVKKRLGNTVAPWQGGFGINATFHGFDASVFCNYSFGNKIVNGTKLASCFNWGSRKGYNLNNDFIGRYTGLDLNTGINIAANPGSDDAIAAYGTQEAAITRLNEMNQGASTWNPAAVGTMSLMDYAVEDASFLRIQNVTLGYTLPKALVNKLYLSNVRFYVTGYNLLTITSYSGSDPETDVSSKKNPMCPGIDYAAYPKSRLFVFGVNVSF